MSAGFFCEISQKTSDTNVGWEGLALNVGLPSYSYQKVSEGSWSTSVQPNPVPPHRTRLTMQKNVACVKRHCHAGTGKDHPTKLIVSNRLKVIWNTDVGNNCDLNWAAVALKHFHVTIKALQHKLNWTDLVEMEFYKLTCRNGAFLYDKPQL